MHSNTKYAQNCSGLALDAEEFSKTGRAEFKIGGHQEDNKCKVRYCFQGQDFASQVEYRSYKNVHRQIPGRNSSK